MNLLETAAYPLAVGYPTMGFVAAVAVGLVAGAVTYALLVAVDLSDAPPRRVAAAVVRRPARSVPPAAVALAHLAWAVAVLLAVWAGGLALGGLGTDPPSAAVAVAVLGGSWWLLTGPLLDGRGPPLDADGGHRPGPETVRREWALVHAVFALAALVAFPAVYYLLLAVVFPPSG